MKEESHAWAETERIGNEAKDAATKAKAVARVALGERRGASGGALAWGIARALVKRG